MTETRQFYQDDRDDQPPRKKAAIMKPLQNLQQLDQSLWLVKLPHFVSEQFSKAQHNSVLGTFRIGLVTESADKAPTKQMIVNLVSPDDDDDEVNNNSEENSANVGTFVLKEVNNAVGSGEEEMVAFTSNEHTESFSVEGRITKSFMLRPQQSSHYRNLVRERGFQKLATRPETHIAEIKDLQRAQKQSYTIESLTSVQQELRRKASDKHSTGGENDYDPRLLKSKVIEAFERYQRLPLNQLLSFCMETVPGFSKETDLRDILGQYAKYNKKGEHKGTWELKEGFASGTVIEENPAH